MNVAAHFFGFESTQMVLFQAHCWDGSHSMSFPEDVTRAHIDGPSLFINELVP
jgi:hypothetical protein